MRLVSKKLEHPQNNNIIKNPNIFQCIEKSRAVRIVRSIPGTANHRNQTHLNFDEIKAKQTGTCTYIYIYIYKIPLVSSLSVSLTK